MAKPEKVACIWSSRKAAKSESKVEGGLRGYGCYKTGPILIGGLSETDAKGGLKMAFVRLLQNEAEFERWPLCDCF